ncbi:Flagellar motor switch FliN protein [Roseivivax marinus]|jgi:flagellar motor switch protein FliN/FliY|uniref:Flagellar motor switch protein FliN n=1 Tax=Roseivivax marinus TaxID=1379903 RepID=W4HFD0_9RHOB|nr:FliM/FliN family flagellar motor switch protein [Roseivivax marinus]ETW11457.1 Flagellar motor switch FliN protein [Roseivivax marinus]UMA66862.1 FliM/FliN family flagellar motor switch protein [Roseivivax marinus]
MSDDTRTASDESAAPEMFGASVPELEDEPAAEKPASGPAASQAHGIEAILNVDLEVQVVLGECRMPISTLLKLGRGSVIELDQRIGEPVSLVINDRVVARGDLVKLPEDRIGVSLTEIVVEHPSSLL